jgi:hypothetical protein
VRRTAALAATLLAAVLLGSVAARGFFSATKTSPQPISVAAPPAGVSHECTNSAAVNANSIAITTCSLQPGWVLVATLGMRGTSANDQSGWSNIGGTTGSGDLSQRSFYRVVTASGPGNYTFNLTGAGRATLGISAYSGVRTSGANAPIETSHDANGTGTTATAPDRPNVSSNTRRIVAVTSATTTVTFPGTMTTRWNESNVNMRGASADAEQAPGNAPATNVTVGNGPWTARTIVLAAAPP